MVEKNQDPRGGEDVPHLTGVYLGHKLDLPAMFDHLLGPGVTLRRPEGIARPEEIRLALCWHPEPDAFDAFPNLELAMSIGAGVETLLTHPRLPARVRVARVRDPHQAQQMAGYVAHEILHDAREFPRMAANAAARHWQFLPLRPPVETIVAVLGHGTMGRAVAEALRVLGFSLRVACRRAPDDPLPGVDYVTGQGAVARAATGAHVLVNVLPLTEETRDVLDADLFARLARGARLIQIGRGAHLVERDLIAALDAGQLSGATLDVFRQEPLPADHPFWGDARLRITPHVASDSTPAVVAAQITAMARALAVSGADALPGPLADLLVDRGRGY